MIDETHFKAKMEVLYVDIFVWSSFALAPQQKTFFSGHFFHRNVLDGETQDDCPNHTQRHFQISIDNFLGTNWNQFYTFGFNEIECFVNVGNLLFFFKRIQK